MCPPRDTGAAQELRGSLAVLKLFPASPCTSQHPDGALAWRSVDTHRPHMSAAEHSPGSLGLWTALPGLYWAGLEDLGPCPHPFLRTEKRGWWGHPPCPLSSHWSFCS